MKYRPFLNWPITRHPLVGLCAFNAPRHTLLPPSLPFRLPSNCRRKSHSLLSLDIIRIGPSRTSSPTAPQSESTASTVPWRSQFITMASSQWQSWPHPEAALYHHIRSQFVVVGCAEHNASSSVATAPPLIPYFNLMVLSRESANSHPSLCTWPMPRLVEPLGRQLIHMTL